MSKKVYIVGGFDAAYARMFRNNGWEVTSNTEDCDLVQFTGGEDVSPELYYEARHPTTYSRAERDRHEMEVFKNAITLNKPMAGICRGGQFLNVMNGGKLFQHVTNHTRSHLATYCVDGRSVLVTSTHHQMFRPSVEGQVFLLADEGGTKEFMAADGSIASVPVGSMVDVEGVFYPKTRSVCFQPHPEFNEGDSLTKLYFDVLNDFIFNQF